MRSTLEFIMAGSEVKRYHTVTTLQTETVGHHSHGVALLCLVLQPSSGDRLLKAALCHDLTEHVTGDIPSPAKRIYGIGEQVSDLEKTLLASVGLSTPDLTEAEVRTLKLADIAQGALFCLREVELGNHRMLDICARYLSYYDAMGLETPGEHTLRGIITAKYKELSK
jgi:5'-deoxynucleotidase YfbR-like HD superfamily hydrolase